MKIKPVNDKEEVRKLLILATMAGKIMLKNGAETYRVEDTIVRICKSRKNIKYSEAFVTPTGIFVSIEYNKEILTYIQRITTIKIDLNKINMVNSFSRNFVNSNISIEQGFRKLKKIDQINTYNNTTKVLYGSISAAFFAVLFGGSFWDSISSFIVSILVIAITNYLSKLQVTFFINNLLGSFLVSILSIILTNIGIGQNMDKIIIGSIMPLVPGVAITNAIRDSISGDYVSGLSRGIEAIITALAIAVGVGAVLKIYFKGLI